ncbi:MAG: metalloregulator ArsR/SmtB family transcription factor [Sedimentibacter sp.]
MKNDYKNYAFSMKALSDETRVKIFEMLSHNELCACNILEEFNITQPTLSYHMKTLCECGLVRSRKDGSRTLYSIDKESLEDFRKFIDTIDGNLRTI